MKPESTVFDPPHSMDPRSRKRREKAIARAQVLLGQVLPFERTGLRASVASQPADVVSAARAQYDELVAAIRKQTVDPSPRIVKIKKDGTAEFRW
ncbi:hypothetical protein [Rhizobacter fulvus]